MVRRKTHEEYIREVEEKHNGNIEVKETYKGSDNKIKHKCNTCACEWDAKPNNILRLNTSVCPECNGNHKKKTQEKYEAEVFEQHGDSIEVTGTYEGNKKKIKHKCNTCKNEWNIVPSSILTGTGCPKCAANAKKTTERYKQEVREKHGDKIEVIGTYEGALTKIKHKCNTCKNEWNIVPSSILQGTGCPKCNVSCKKSDEQYKQEVHEKYGDSIVVIGTYETSMIKIKHKCNVCNHEWDTAPQTVLTGDRCPKCFLEARNEQYKQEVREKHGDKIEVIGTYETRSIKIKHKCNVCENEWDMAPSSVLRGHGCLKCSGFLRRTHEQYKREVREKHGDKIEVIGTFETVTNKIKHKCNVCKREWDTTPQNILAGYACRECSNKDRTKTDEQYKQEVREKHGDNIEVVGTYANATTEIKHKCNTCGKEWNIKPTYILTGTGCNKCNESKGERFITRILERLNIEFDTQVSFNTLGFKKRKRLTCDFVLYKNGKPVFVIEYNGEQHYKSVDRFGGEEILKKTIERDHTKRKMLNKAGIPVVDIPYTETDEQVFETITYFVNYFKLN
ncbi:zinc-ribbon domain-containing protein [Bacillus toyonensis]